jgi:hypothetical protein
MFKKDLFQLFMKILKLCKLIYHGFNEGKTAFYKQAQAGTFAETANVDYRLFLPTNEKKLPCSVCRKQTEVCRFRFPFAAKEHKFPFYH